MLPSAEIEIPVSASEQVIEKEYNNTNYTASEQLCFKKKPVYDFFKRAFDIIASLCALIILSPVFLITAVAIMIDDFGNPFFVQARTGYKGKDFKMFKFRSMYKNSEKKRDDLLSQNEADGPIFKITDDPRVTKVGKFIRKTSIDELPQLLNILIGQMSVIGPRPLPTYEQAACNEYQNQRLLVKPGLSCYTALDKKSEENFDNWIELDMKYIRERSFATDVKIIFQTVLVVFKKGNH